MGREEGVGEEGEERKEGELGESGREGEEGAEEDGRSSSSRRARVGRTFLLKGSRSDADPGFSVDNLESQEVVKE